MGNIVFGVIMVCLSFMVSMGMITNAADLLAMIGGFFIGWGGVNLIEKI